MRYEPEGETVVSCLLDQANLHGVLIRIRDLGINFFSVKCIRENDGAQSVDHNR